MSADDRTRSVRELARRILRSRGVIIRHPSELAILEDLSVQISDLAPSLQFGVNFKENDGDEVVIETLGENGGRISSHPPNNDEVWIPLPLASSFEKLISETLALARAGYPGCLGCGGPDAEEPWDESAARLRFLSSG